MMKRLKIILLIILFAFIVPVDVSARTGTHPPGVTISCAACHNEGPEPILNRTAYNNVCTGCHKPGNNGANKPFEIVAAANTYGTITSVRTGTIYQTSHNWAGSDVNPMAGASPPINPLLSNSNTYGYVSCARCHSVMGAYSSATISKPYLRIRNDNDEMCRNCHLAFDTSSHLNGSHPININYTSTTSPVKLKPTEYHPTPVNANPANPTSAMKLVNGVILCSTCHGVHYTDSNSETIDGSENYSTLTPSKGYLLRTDARGKTADDVNICTNCHAGKGVHNAKSQNIQCNDCHSAHVEYDPIAYQPEEKIKNKFLVRRFMNVSTQFGSVRNARTFFRYTGATSKEFYIGTSGRKGVCQSCHYETISFAYRHYIDGYATYGLKSNYDATQCLTCHNHQNNYSVTGAPLNKPSILSTIMGTVTNGWYSGKVTIALTATDNESGIESMSYFIDDGSPNKIYGESTSFELVSDGVHKVAYGVTNNADNQATGTLSIPIDSTSPVIKISFPSTPLDIYPLSQYPTYQLGVAEPAFTASDSLSGISGTPVGVKTGTPDEFGCGIFTYTVTATDKAGNTSTESVTYAVTAAPTITGYHPANGSFVPSTLTVQATFSEQMNPASLGDSNFTLSRRGRIRAIVGGHDHNVALRADGTVVAWGSNQFGQSIVPVGLSGVVAIDAGGFQTLALKANGTVAAWGSTYYGTESTVPADLTAVTAIAAGTFHSVALKSDGTLTAWGYNGYGQTAIPEGLAGIVAVAAGGYHTVGLRTDGTVVAWGYNASGQCTVPDGLSGVTALAAGDSFTVALKNDGTVVGWGANNQGQLTIPVEASGVIAIAAKGSHTVALKRDGTVVAWGSNVWGERNVPPDLSDVIAITAEDWNTVALKSDGTVVIWGSNSFGQSNIPTDLEVSFPVNGIVTYDSATLTATFTPSLPLVEGTYYSSLMVARNLAGVPIVPLTWPFNVVDTTAPVTTASMVAGSYSMSQSVRLTTDEWAKIYYTTDGTDPTTASPVYSGPIAITSTTVLKFFARDTSGNNETLKTEVYNIGKLDQSISCSSIPSKVYGDAPFTIDCVATSGRPLTYTSSNPVVATVTGSVVTIVGAGSATINVLQSGDATYNPAVASQEIIVNALKIIVGETITYATTVTAAYAAIPDGGTATFTLTAGTLTENLLFNRNCDITIKGGYNPQFSGITGVTEIIGTLTIEKGSVTIDGLIVIR